MAGPLRGLRPVVDELTAAAVRSPDGGVEVVFAGDTVGHHTIHEPAVHRVCDGALVLDLRGTSLDSRLGTSFPAPGRVRLELRKYPAGSVLAYDLVVDVEAETFGWTAPSPTGWPGCPTWYASCRPRSRRSARPTSRRYGTSAFDTTQPFECLACGAMW